MSVAGPIAPAAEPDHRILAAIEALGQRLAGVRTQIDRVISTLRSSRLRGARFGGRRKVATAEDGFGQDAVVDQTLITLLSGGHALSIGVPVLPPSAVMLRPVLHSRQRAKVAPAFATRPPQEPCSGGWKRAMAGEARLAAARATEDGRTDRSSLATEGGLVETRARCWASDDKRVQCLGSPRVTPGPPAAPGFAGPAIRSTLHSPASPKAMPEAAATEDGRARRRA